MANREHVVLLKRGVVVWNKWRQENPEIQPDFGEADLRGANLTLTNLSGADLRKATLLLTNLSEAELRGADLSEADLTNAILTSANLTGADLTGADLKTAQFCKTIMPDGSTDNRDCPRGQ
jgi:uncharacterized protein YjbI with pentapeptide repeats